MAQDLQRYLTGRPVTARPPTLSYRTRKFVRRYRVQVGAAAITAVAIVAGVAAGGLGWVRTRRAEAAAKQEAAAARQVSDFLVRLFTTSDPNAAPGSPVTVRQVLEEGTRKVQTELAGLPEARGRRCSEP